MSRLKTGGYAPLFDRLAQVEDSKREVAHWLDIKQLERSVFKELIRITQTRSRLTSSEFLNKKNSYSFRLWFTGFLREICSKF